MQMLLIALIGVSIGLLLGLAIGFRAGFLALRVAARVITVERRGSAHTEIQLAA